MEEQSEQQMGIEEQQQKHNEQPEMDSENSFNEERNNPDHHQLQDESPLEEEEHEGEMEEEKNNDNPDGQISIQRQPIVDEQISEQAQVEEEADQQQQIEENSQKEGSIQEEGPPKDEIIQQNIAIIENQQAPLSPQQHQQPQNSQKSQQQPAFIDIKHNQSVPEQKQASPQKQFQEEARVEQQKLQKAAQEQAQAQAVLQAELQLRKIQQNFAYTNHIQQMLQSLSHSLSKSRGQEQALRNANKVLSCELAASKQAVMDLRKRKMQLQTQRLKQNKELQRSRKENSEFRDKLAEIQKIGDILLLQCTLEELQVLTKAQNQQIGELKLVNSQQAHNYYQQQFNMLESYQAELTSAKQQIQSLNVELEITRNDLTQMEHLKKQLQTQNRGQLQLIGVLQGDKQNLKGELSLWQKKWESFEEERAEFKRTRQLDQRVSQYESQRFMGEENEVQLIPVLSDREEKNLLLKEYLKLEALYEHSKSRAQDAESRLKRLLRDSKVQQANSIRKKDYQDLLSKYRKAKNCLQGAFVKLKSLERVQKTARDISEEVDELLQGNQSRLYQALMRRTSEQQQLVSDRINEMQWNDEIVTLKRQNVKLRQSALRLERQLKNNEKILFLVNDELQCRKKITQEKTKIIERLIAAGCHHNSEHYQQRINELERQLHARDENLSALQVKTVLLIRENQSNLQQINHWRALYAQVKEHLTQKITTSLTESSKPLLFREEPQTNDSCRQCQKRSLAIVTPTEFSTAHTQTEGNYDLQYKEIRESLLCLKRINKEVDSIPESHQKTIRLITEFKDKYEKHIDKYNAKFLDLKKEKAENEVWRTRAKQDIREEFQQIRDIISNSRLATALRQAKSLIDYLQNEQEKGQQQEQGEMEQQNEAVEEKL